jgi:hypothetical protein
VAACHSALLICTWTAWRSSGSSRFIVMLLVENLFSDDRMRRTLTVR